MLAGIFEALQRPRNRKVCAAAMVVLAAVASVASCVLLGWAGLLLVVPCLAVAGGAAVIALAAVRVNGDPMAPHIVGWRSGWFDLDQGSGTTRNLVMARGWQDPEAPRLDSPLDAQVAALLTEVQYLRDALASHGMDVPTTRSEPRSQASEPPDLTGDEPARR